MQSSRVTCTNFDLTTYYQLAPEIIVKKCLKVLSYPAKLKKKIIVMKVFGIMP